MYFEATRRIPRLNCVGMTKADSAVLLGAIHAARRELAAQGMLVTIRRKRPLKTNSTLSRR